MRHFFILVTKKTFSSFHFWKRSKPIQALCWPMGKGTDSALSTSSRKRAVCSWTGTWSCSCFPACPMPWIYPEGPGKDPQRVRLGGVRWHKRESICSGSCLHPDARTFRCNFEDPGISHERNRLKQDDKRASKQTGPRNESPLERSSAPCL